MLTAWIFDRTLVVDVERGRMTTTPSRAGATIAGLAIGLVPATLLWGERSAAYELTVSGYAFVCAFGLLAIALVVVPWLPSNRRVVVDLASRELTVGSGAAEVLERVTLRTSNDARGRARAEVFLHPLGAPLRWLYLANDGADFAVELVAAANARLASGASEGDGERLARLAPGMAKMHRQSIVTAVALVGGGLALGAILWGATE